MSTSRMSSGTPSDRPCPRVDLLLCDADGTLLASQEPAYAASFVVIARFLAHLGIEQSYEPQELRHLAAGRNFRALARLLARLHDRRLDEDDLDEWVAVERDVVTAHLRGVLEPDPAVAEPFARVAQEVPVAVVTPNAVERVRACLEVTRLDRIVPSERLVSGETAVRRRGDRPDPHVHRLACDRLGVDPSVTVAVEATAHGVRSAVRAGCWTIGLLQATDAPDRPLREAALVAAGASAVFESWDEVARFLHDQRLRHDPTPPLSEPA